MALNHCYYRLPLILMSMALARTQRRIEEEARQERLAIAKRMRKDRLLFRQVNSCNTAGCDYARSARSVSARRPPLQAELAC